MRDGTAGAATETGRGIKDLLLEGIGFDKAHGLLEKCIDESGLKFLGIARCLFKTERDAVFLAHLPEKLRLFIYRRCHESCSASH